MRIVYFIAMLPQILACAMNDAADEICDAIAYDWARLKAWGNRMLWKNGLL